MKIFLIIGGVHSLLFGVFHCMFYKLLHWKKELKKITPANQAVMQILNLRLIYIFFLHSFFCIFVIDKLHGAAPVNYMLAASALFWLGRTIEQFVFMKQLPFKHPANRLLTIMFIIGIAIYAIPLFDQVI